MIDRVKNLREIKNEVGSLAQITPEIIVVTKNHNFQEILPLLEANHLHFGENKVQEAYSKYKDAKIDFPNIKLHLIGSLQTNKVKDAVKLFDYIHTIDRKNLADEIKKQLEKTNKKIELFIQVNTGDEPNKGGVSKDGLDALFNHCQKLPLPITGLMCIPPVNQDPLPHFSWLQQRAKDYSLKNLSMGMSNDYKQASFSGSTFLRIGTAIMGERK
jgi:pyridoxal phosphate enzyme (YggS family)